MGICGPEEADTEGVGKRTEVSFTEKEWVGTAGRRTEAVVCSDPFILREVFVTWAIWTHFRGR